MITVKEKILSIEDDPSTLRLVSYALQHEGYEVITATNGLDGLRKALETAPDLIILDVMLPGLDGFEVCHRLRGEPKTARTPILMFSAKYQEADKTTGVDVGANDYLIKPAYPSEVVKRVQALLAKTKQPKDATSLEMETNCNHL